MNGRAAARGFTPKLRRATWRTSTAEDLCVESKTFPSAPNAPKTVHQHEICAPAGTFAESRIHSVCGIVREMAETLYYCEWIHQVPAYKPYVEDQNRGHGLTWKYQEYAIDKILTLGSADCATVAKPYTGIMTKYRVFVFLVIFVKIAIALLLGWYGVGFIIFTKKAEEIIFNTLAVFFVLSIDDIIYIVIMPKIGRAALQADKHRIGCESEVITRKDDGLGAVLNCVHRGLFYFLLSAHLS